MKNISIRPSGLKLALVMSLFLPFLANAQQYFTDTQAGDVNAGFRKTGSNKDAYEMVVYLGNVSNLMMMPIGTTTNFTFYTNQLDVTMCTNNLGNLQWSAFSSVFVGGSSITFTNSGYTWPEYTCWYTCPRTNVSVQTTAPSRLSATADSTLQNPLLGVSSGANALSQFLASPTQQGNTNANNNWQLVQEPTADANDDEELTLYIGDSQTPSLGDFGGSAINYSVENVNPGSFTTADVSDFYVNVPNSFGRNTYVDPLSGQTTGSADFLGYFTLNPNGVLSFTRAAVSAPSAGTVGASATNGFGPLTVTFSSTATGSITNWVWNFGNGVMVTNTTGANVNATYTLAGSYTVTLTVYGPGGSSFDTIANFIVTSPTPKLQWSVMNGNLVFTGTNCPANIQYRFLSTTNLAASAVNWNPVYTNTFRSNGTFFYTNSISSSKHSFFIMVSP